MQATLVSGGQDQRSSVDHQMSAASLSRELIKYGEMAQVVVLLAMGKKNTKAVPILKIVHACTWMRPAQGVLTILWSAVAHSNCIWGQDEQTLRLHV